MNLGHTPQWLRRHSTGMMTAGFVLALLYLGRSVLIPLALAIMLSLLVAPLVRALRRIRVGRTCSVLIAVLALTVSCLAAAAALGNQVLHIAASLPQYETNVHRKLASLNLPAVDRLSLVVSDTSRLIETPSAAVAAGVAGGAADTIAVGPAATPPGSQAVRRPPLALMGKILKSLWGPAQFIGIVLLVLVFVLLEQETLRDRLIRILGPTDIRATTLALNDAGERLSRYFVSQFAVNLAFGLAIWLSLSVLRVPQAMLWGTLAGTLRFVPYVGVGIAALFASAMAFAVDPGWSLALSTLVAFVLLDVVAGQLLEPHLYGHATGLSPLSVVVAAIFWSALWGPAGLVLSTPLTLCLLVAGRHISGLGFLELLLGNVQPLTLPQKFYQRALSGDPQEIIADARAFLKNDSLAGYCDRVLIPALHLARLDVDAGATSEPQHVRIRGVVVDVLAVLGRSSLAIPRRRPRNSVLDEVSPGRWLRQQREQSSGRWQGPIGVPSRSIVICLGMGSSADDLATELLVRLLRDQGLDARHFSPADLDAGLPPGADPDDIAGVNLVSAFPSPERERAHAIAMRIRTLFPHALLAKVFCRGVATPPQPDAKDGNVDHVAGSLVEALDLCLSLRESRIRPAAAKPGGLRTSAAA